MLAVYVHIHMQPEKENNPIPWICDWLGKSASYN